MDLTEKQLEELRLGALTAIDGLWFLAAERKLGFEAALELDLEVWKDYGVVLLRRLARDLGLKLDPADPPGLAAINDILATLCLIDGTRCSWEMTDESASIFRVHHCSWWENLRRAGREKTVPCEMIDNTIFIHWLQAVDPSIRMEITNSLPRGDDHCAWTLTRST
jgi:hypothetical protein